VEQRCLHGNIMAETGDNYFTDLKKGEVGEIRQLLSTPGIDREPARKREVLKKVIAYMTMGVDMSRLFSDMIKVRRFADLLFKKGRDSR
jgi:vesicle coat complex subunit